MSKEKDYIVKVKLELLVLNTDKDYASNYVYETINDALDNWGIDIITESYKAKKTTTKDILIDKLNAEVKSLSDKLTEYQKKDIKTTIGMKHSIKEALDTAIQPEVNFNLTEASGYISPLETADMVVVLPERYTQCTECLGCC
jgi:hypothetical protein